MASKEIGMGQASAFQRALEQFDALRLFWEIFEGHAGEKVRRQKGKRKT